MSDTGSVHLQQYFEIKGAVYESLLSDFVNDAVSSEADNIEEHMAEWLQRRRQANVAAPSRAVEAALTAAHSSAGEASGLKWMHLGSAKPHNGRELSHEALATALSNSTEFTQAEWDAFGVHDLRTDSFISSAGAYFGPASAASQPGIADWTVPSWMGAPRRSSDGGDRFLLADPVSAALLKPLGADAASPHATIAYMRTLCTDQAAVRKLLEDSHVLDALASAVCDAATAELSLAGGGTSTTSAAEALSGKFAAENAFTLHYGKLDMFYSGLEGRLGRPQPNLYVAMEDEHTRSIDSRDEFTTSNYGVETTSQIEWWFVVDPVEGRRALRRKDWPIEHEEKIHPEKRRGNRGEVLLSQFDGELEAKNRELEAMGETCKVSRNELLAARMYTGPVRATWRSKQRAPNLTPSPLTWRPGLSILSNLIPPITSARRCSKSTTWCCVPTHAPRSTRGSRRTCCASSTSCARATSVFQRSGSNLVNELATHT